RPVVETTDRPVDPAGRHDFLPHLQAGHQRPVRGHLPPLRPDDQQEERGDENAEVKEGYGHRVWVTGWSRNRKSMLAEPFAPSGSGGGGGGGFADRRRRAGACDGASERGQSGLEEVRAAGGLGRHVEPEVRVRGGG